MSKNLTFILFIFCTSIIFSQETIQGIVYSDSETIPYVKIIVKSLKINTISDINGRFRLENIPNGMYELKLFAFGFKPKTISIKSPSSSILKINIEKESQNFKEVVVSGTLKETSKKESIVNVEIYRPKILNKNPSPSIYESIGIINGVRPQLNCNVCNTGDIQINGLEGAYTMMLIDGMPIVSSLSTVYGLTGIPNSIIDRIEVIKGPGSTLYGSEAIGGVINVITKKTQNENLLSLNLFTTSWLETNTDIALKSNIKGKASILTGINYFKYNYKRDNNQDGFTDVTLQDRISIFQKWNFKRKDYKLFTLAARYLYEDRWGGDINWNPNFRGGDSIYGESIYTNRYEFIINYELPFKERIFISASLNNHNQNSYYGNIPFMGNQFVGFSQIHYDKKIRNHNMIFGSAIRFTKYDDNTTATQIDNSSTNTNNPIITYLPGFFIQDELKFNNKHKLLLGFRYDYNTNHGSIFTPRIGYKWTISPNDLIRINTGTGYRVVNIFTEDHAALTGAREVSISNDIEPEESYNANINFNKTIISKKKQYINIDFTGFYTYFTNRIIPDYDTDPNFIFYKNLSSHAISQGISFNITANIIKNLSIQFGGTFMDISTYNNGIKKQQILTEKFSGTWNISYKIEKLNLNIDYTGNVYSPMRLPLLNELDPRPEFSPWWNIQNIQITYSLLKSWEIYGGVKNLLNWTPNKNAPFIIARSNDPFDKNVLFDNNGNALSTANNPYALTFDPSYAYAPNQGIRGFLGIRYLINYNK